MARHPTRASRTCFLSDRAWPCLPARAWRHRIRAKALRSLLHAIPTGLLMLQYAEFWRTAVRLRSHVFILGEFFARQLRFAYSRPSITLAPSGPYPTLL